MTRGVTLIELLVVLGLISVIAGFSAFEGFDSYHQTPDRIEVERRAAYERFVEGKVLRRMTNTEWPFPQITI